MRMKPSDVNHWSFYGSPLCGRNGWALSTKKTTCKRCLREIEKALQISQAVRLIFREAR